MNLRFRALTITAAIALGLLFGGCATSGSTGSPNEEGIPSPPMPATPPVPPQTDDRTAHLRGVVRDPSGEPVWGADVRAAIADEICTNPDAPRFTTTQADGSFALELHAGFGADQNACVLIEAHWGGASTRDKIMVPFTSPGSRSVDEPPLDIPIRLPRVPEPTPSEREAVVGRVLEAMTTTDPAVRREASRYVRGGPEALEPALTDLSSYLRTIRSTQALGKGAYRVTGVSDRSVTLQVVTDPLLEIRNDVLAHARRAHALIRHVLHVLGQGDAARLAAILSVPEDEAHRQIRDFQKRFALETVSASLVGVDETGRTLHYRLDGARPGTDQIAAGEISLGYDDAVVWVRALR